MAATRMGEQGLAVGLQLPVQAQSTIFAQAWEAGAGSEEIVAVARACEAAGFAYVAACDHIAIPEAAADAMGTAWWDTVATLAYVAAATERIALLGHVYVLAYRHPLASAKAWATLDALSGGRAVLGVGAGHVRAEFDALGASFADRGRLLDEAIDAVRACFADEYPRHHGDTWRFEGLGQRPRPAQDRLPIWVGGSSAPAMRRAAERGDGWLPQGAPEGGLAAAVAAIRARRAEVRDDPITIGALAGPVFLGQPAWGAGRCVTGPATTLAGYLRSLRAAGADQVQVSFPSRSCAELCDQIAAFGAEVLPLLADGAAT